jgi:Na+-translocating ferredoxin:NAD+ oxidoreductase RnfC subunit
MDIERIEENGVVGAGGAGFPTAVKLRTPVPTLLVNAAECEPLLHKDKELLRRQAEPLLAGLRVSMELLGAKEAVIGIKNKYEDVIASLKPLLPSGVRIFPLHDSYPAGDEFILVHDVTGRVIPPGGLPKDVGTVTMNVETLVNIGLDRPVTHKYLTVAGAVKTPVTLRLPVGISVGEVVAAAGGATTAPWAVLVGGTMMGRLAEGPDEPITKTTGGLIVLPATHPLILRHGAKWGQIARIGRSACDQCRFCTEFCPRYLLGHPIEPHAAMRALGFTEPPNPTIAGTLYCCECNLCSLYACPEDLDPKNVCVESKPIARERGLVFKGAPEDVKVHPLAEGRRVPTRRLMARLGLNGFRNVGPLVEHELAPERVVLPLKQHAGAPAAPAVRAGERVNVGDVVARPADGQLGAPIHASIDGTVRGVDGAVEIES